MANQLPDYLQQYQAPDLNTQLSQNLGSAMPPHVSIGGGRFTLIDAANNEIPGAWHNPQVGVYIDACIADVNNVKSRIYFSGAYDSDAEGVRPDCFSDNGIAPSISCNSPQAPSCQPDPTGVHGCRWAVWGSKINPNGKKVPACSEKQKVALLIPGYDTLFLLAIPPNSHGPLREYVELCKGHGMNMANLITRISFVPGVQGTLQFHAVSYIDEPMARLRQAAYAEKKTDAIVGRNDVPRQAMIAPPNMEVAPNMSPGQIAHINAPQVQQALGQQAIGMMQQPATNIGQTAQQVQQPGFFAPVTLAPAAAQQPMMQTTPQGTPQFQNPSATSTIPNTAGQGGTAPIASPSDQQPTQRRRRRTAAEMAAANGAAGHPQPTGQAPQAPFPHPGAQQTAAASQVPSEGSFGIAQGQPAGANPEVSAMLDDFFGKT